MKELLRELADYPAGAYQLWNPAFRFKTEEQLNREIKHYEPVYKIALFCKKTATIYLYK